MRVFTISHSDTSGGAARAAYRIHTIVNAAGTHSVMLVKTKKSNDNTVVSVASYNKPDVFKTLYRFLRLKLANKLQKVSWNRYPNRDRVFLSDLRSEPLNGALQKADFDVLHLHWINLRFLNIKELEKVKKPIIWTLHDCWPFTGICHYFYDCEKFQCSCGNCPFLHSDREKDLSWEVWNKKQKIYTKLNLHIVAPSQWLGEAARQSTLFSKFPVTVIPNPIDTKLFAPGSRNLACDALGLDKNRVYIMFAAMNAIEDTNKGFDKLVLALSYLEKYASTYEIGLLIIGSDKPLDTLRTSIPVYNMGVVTTEENMVNVYRASKLSIVPSLSENLSYAIMESMACGTPVVAFDIGGNSDMIDHQQNGYLAEAFSGEDLAKGIHWCLQADREKLSQQTRKKIEDNFAMDIVARKYIDLYKSLLP